MLEVRDISWQAPGGEQVLDRVSLHVKAGGFTAVTGPNGSGKSTLLKIIAGLERPAGGKILLEGEDISGLDVTTRAKKGVCLAFQQPVRFKGFTVGRLLELAAGRPLSQEQACALLAQAGLCGREYLGRQADGSLSGGEMKRLEISTVLARKGRLLLFDEPEAGIDLWSFNNLIQVFEDMHRESGSSLILISHQERILNIADEIIVLAEGCVRARGRREEILPDLLRGTESCKFYSASPSAPTAQTN